MSGLDEAVAAVLRVRYRNFAPIVRAVALCNPVDRADAEREILAALPEALRAVVAETRNSQWAHDLISDEQLGDMLAAASRLARGAP